MQADLGEAILIGTEFLAHRGARDVALGQVLRGLAIASGALLIWTGAAMAVAAKRRGLRTKKVCQAHRSQAQQAVGRANYFEITKSRGTVQQAKWVLQGFGRYQCFLLFDSWQEAMDQASFRLESLGSDEFVQLRAKA